MSDAGCRFRATFPGTNELTEIEQEDVMQLVAGLANCFDKELIVETVGTLLDVEPVHVDNCVHFDDLTLRFDDAGRIDGMYRVIDGTADTT